MGAKSVFKKLCSFGVVIVAIVCGMAMNMWPHRVNCLKACHANPLGWNSDAEKGTDFCALNDTSAINIVDFQAKGYTVVNSFLSESEVTSLLDIWWNTPDLNVPGKNGGGTPGYKIPDKINMFEEIPSLARKILQAKAQIEAETDVFISAKDADPRTGDFQMTGLFFHTSANKSGSMMFGWHQDVENYFQSDNLYNWLSFYIMLEKPSRDEAGIDVVPFDGLKARSPALHELSAGCSGTKGCNFVYETEEKKTYVVNADNDRPAFLGFSLNDVSCTPSVGPGDLVLFRGDVFHRTQPHNSYRTSLNVVLRPGVPTLKLENQMRGGHTKYKWMEMCPHCYAHYHPHRQDEYHKQLQRGWLIRNTLWPVRHLLEYGIDLFGVALP